jgi:hypothetical protein
MRRVWRKLEYKNRILRCPTETTLRPVKIATRCKARTGSNPSQGMDMSARPFYVLC